MIFTSEIVRCDVPNKNGHVYTKECIESALENLVIKEQIEKGCFFGGFIDDNRLDFEILLCKVSHVCKELWWEDNTLYGKFETLNTPKGKILEKALNNDNTLKENCMTISGCGCISKDGLVHDFDLMSINFTEEKT